MPTLGNLRRYDLKYNFEVFIAGLADLAFATCSEPSCTVGEGQLWQGGSLIPIKEPTRLTFNDITLERGMSRNTDIWAWFTTQNNAAAAGGLAGSGAGAGYPNLYKRHVQIAQKDRAGTWVERIELFNAWPKELSLGDFSNDADEFRIERLVLSYDWFDRIPLTPV
jgi:phage tail-like protein